MIGNPRCSVDSRSSICARGHHNLFNSSVIITIMWASQPYIVIIIALSHHHMIIIIVIIKWAQPPDLWCIKRQLNITSPTAIKAGEPMSTWGGVGSNGSGGNGTGRRRISAFI